jgi:hypothetical protein
LPLYPGDENGEFFTISVQIRSFSMRRWVALLTLFFVVILIMPGCGDTSASAPADADGTPKLKKANEDLIQKGREAAKKKHR